jgi:RNA polymerase sigma-70 factor (ECF subfamily)
MRTPASFKKPARSERVAAARADCRRGVEPIEPFRRFRIPLCNAPFVASLDSELLNSARQNAPDAWDTLLKRHQLPLYTHAAELLRNDSAALDVVQETFAAAVRHIGSLRNDARFASWLFGIAHQKCVQHWRRTRRDEAVFASSIDESANDLVDPDGMDPSALLLQREQTEEFFDLVECLPPAQRATLLLHVLEDFSLSEIGSITGVPVGTVKSRLHHARRALRKLVEATQ